MKSESPGRRRRRRNLYSLSLWSHTNFFGSFCDFWACSGCWKAWRWSGAELPGLEFGFYLFFSLSPHNFDGHFLLPELQDRAENGSPTASLQRRDTFSPGIHPRPMKTLLHNPQDKPERSPPAPPHGFTHTVGARMGHTPW